jgi:serine protease AprX
LVSPTASPAELAAVRAHLRVLNHESRLRQGSIILGALPPGQLEVLAQSSAVLWVEPAPRRKLFDEAAAKIVGGDDGNLATRTTTQQLGFDGTGVIVSVADTGLDTGDTNTMHLDLFGRVTGFKFYGTNGITDGSDGYGHGTHCAGIVAGNAASGEIDPDTGQFYGLGVAPGAKLFVQRLFGDDATEARPFPSDETITRDAVRSGAKIGSNSWGVDSGGEYDLDCAQFDELVRDADAGTAGYQPYILEFSAGNSGPGSQTIGSPASAKNVIATGASQNAPATLSSTYGLYAEGPDAMADFSSRGPCADGRIKPDVVAPGTWIASAASSYALDPAGTSV